MTNNNHLSHRKCRGECNDKCKGEKSFAPTPTIGIIILILLIGIQTTPAKVLAVLEIIPSSESVNLTITELRHLTDELRTQAREALPRNYSILTRDNIFQLLPPDEDERECLDESCAVEIGRAIGAEYVTQGFVGMFEGMLTLTVELYESMSGNMLGSFVTESENARGLLETIRARAPGLFARIVPPEPVPAPAPSLVPVPAPAPVPESLSKDTPPALQSPIPNPQSPKKSRSPTFIALSLDILGAAAIGFGVYQNFNADKFTANYNKPPDNLPSNLEELQAFHKTKTAELKKMRDAKTMRNIAYGVGGALLAAGIAVHIWF